MKKVLSTGPGLLIAIPTLGRPINLDWALAFKAVNPPINYNINFSIIKGQEIDMARQAFAEQAIEKDAKYLFFIGDDVIMPPHTLGQLIFRMENDPSVGVVGGVYCSKTEIPYPLIFKGNGKGAYWDWKIGEYFDCSGIGMDCTLIRTDVFRHLSKPFFKTVSGDQYLDGINNAESWTEDLFFCKKVLEETDYKVMVDTSIMCDHFDIYSGKVYKLPKGSLPFRQRTLRQGAKKVLIIGPSIELTEEHDVVRCDENDESADYRCSWNNLPFDRDSFDWVIVTALVSSSKFPLDEWKRVSKEKISFNIHPLFNSQSIAKEYGGTVDGSFVEILKNGTSSSISVGS